MRKIFTLLLIASLFVFFAGGSVAKASETTRAYFKIKTPSALTQIRPYMRHDFGEGVFSIEAPRYVIQALAKNKFLEFRGEASLWQITEELQLFVRLPPLFLGELQKLMEVREARELRWRLLIREFIRATLT